MPRLIVISGASGSGKSTLLTRLMKEYDVFGFSVSHTTRQPRPGEIDGKDYHFVDRETMKGSLAAGEFIEHAEYASNLYGTSFKAVEDIMQKKRIPILDVDSEGVKNIKKLTRFVDPLYVFIQPPSLEVLELRLKARGTETEDSLAKRLALAKREMDYASQGVYNHRIVNDKVDEAYTHFKSALMQDIEAALKMQES